MSDKSNRSLGSSIKKGLKHTQELDPSEDQVLKKEERGSDVPLFLGKGKDSLGMDIKKVYNRCMSLLAYQPKGDDPLENKKGEKEVKYTRKKLEDWVVKLIKTLKHEKEAYSSTWKKYFPKYEHHLKKKHVAYDDKDPFDDTWIKHELLEKSIEMQAAAAVYLQEAEIILGQFDEILKYLEEELEEAAKSQSLTLDEWAQKGQEHVLEELKRAQKQVDAILLEEWKAVGKYLVGEFKGLQPSYIGSTNTGQKSITKAYVQFNPNDFDVDGQLVSSELYALLGSLGLPASKGRFFVRQVTKQALKEIALQMQHDKTNKESIQQLTQLQNVLMALAEYVERVEKRIPDEVRGVMKDDTDPFDLAIVKSL